MYTKSITPLTPASQVGVLETIPQSLYAGNNEAGNDSTHDNTEQPKEQVPEQPQQPPLVASEGLGVTTAAGTA